MKIACECCRYFAPKTVGHQRNECRRHTPAARLANNGHHELAVGIWPVVSPDGWCGEFEHRFAALRDDHAPANAETQ